MARALSATVLAAAALLAGSAPSADARVYTATGCLLNQGVVRLVQNPGFNAEVFPCGNPFGDVRVAAGAEAVSGGPIHGSAGWAILAPPDTTIERVEMERLLDFQGANQMEWVVFKTDGATVRQTVELARADGTSPPSGGVIYEVHAATLTGVFGCPIARGCTGPAGTSTVVTSKNFLVSMDDEVPPTATVLAPAGTLSGTVSLPYAAVDRGSGVLSTRLLLDFPSDQPEEVVVAGDQDINRGACREHQPYTELAPCKLQIASFLSLDTTQIPDGRHRLTVETTDAAGNSRLGNTVPIVVKNAADPPDIDPPTDPVPPTADTTPPALRRLSLSRTRVRRGATTLRFASSEAATLSVAVFKLPKKKTGKAPRPLATLTRVIAAGPGKLVLRRRLGRKRLGPGRYRLAVLASDAAGNRSNVVRLGFTILPG